MSASLRDNSFSEQSSLQIRSQLNGLITEIQNNPYHWPNAHNAFPYPPCHDIHIHLLQSLNDNHSCFFFVFQKRQSFILAFFFVFKLSHKKTHCLSYSQDLPESKKWRRFHLHLKYWSAHGTHTHTFIRRHIVRLTPAQSHWQSKPHFKREKL